MNTAPKERPILLDIGHPWAVMGVWNEVNKEWVYASYQVGMYDGRYNDTYFENESTDAPQQWRHLPEITHEL
jgi:hypothetical protein